MLKLNSKKVFLSNFLQHIRLRYVKPCYKFFLKSLWFGLKSIKLTFSKYYTNTKNVLAIYNKFAFENEYFCLEITENYFRGKIHVEIENKYSFIYTFPTKISYSSRDRWHLLNEKRQNFHSLIIWSQFQCFRFNTTPTRVLNYFVYMTVFAIV